MNPDLDNLARGRDFPGILDEVIRHAGNVHESVIVQSDVHKCPEAGHVADRSLQLHPGSQVLNRQDILLQDRCIQAVTRIQAGIAQFADDVDHGVGSHSQASGFLNRIDPLQGIPEGL